VSEKKGGNRKKVQSKKVRSKVKNSAEPPHHHQSIGSKTDHLPPFFRFCFSFAFGGKRLVEFLLSLHGVAGEKVLRT